MRRTYASSIAPAAGLILVLTGCSTMGGGGEASGRDGAEPSDSGAGQTGGNVVLLTHESFSLPKKLIKSWESETGYTLEVRGAGDAGTLATKLSLSADNPEGDAAFGIDNTFAGRPIDAGAFAEYAAELPDGAEQYAFDEAPDMVTPVDNASVCVNVDTAWFAENDVPPPTTLDDLTKPAYEGLFVTPGASTSSPGMAFFLATVAEYGDEWPAYWEDLLANDAKVVDGWEDAYYGDFTAGSESGQRPIVTSYDSSPAFTINDAGESTTEALLDTCFRQVEYAGVLEGAANPEGAQAVIDWLLTDEVQSALPKSMYVFPVSDTATIPEDWQEFAIQPDAPLEVSPSDIAENRDQWLTEWADVISR